METEKDDIKQIKIKYDNEKKELAFKLIKSERIILDFQESKIDIATIEIIPKIKLMIHFFYLHTLILMKMKLQIRLFKLFNIRMEKILHLVKEK